MTVEQTLRVTSIRSQNPRGFGGCIFSAKSIDCWRRFKIDHLFRLNFDQGSKAGFSMPGC